MTDISLVSLNVRGQLLTACSKDRVMTVLEAQTGERNKYPLLEAILDNFSVNLIRR